MLRTGANGELCRQGGRLITSQGDGCVCTPGQDCPWYFRATSCPDQECVPAGLNVYICSDARCSDGTPLAINAVIRIGPACYRIDASFFVRCPPPPSGGFQCIPDGAVVIDDPAFECAGGCADPRCSGLYWLRASTCACAAGFGDPACYLVRCTAYANAVALYGRSCLVFSPIGPVDDACYKVGPTSEVLDRIPEGCFEVPIDDPDFVFVYDNCCHCCSELGDLPEDAPCNYDDGRVDQDPYALTTYSDGDIPLLSLGRCCCGHDVLVRVSGQFVQQTGIYFGHTLYETATWSGWISKTAASVTYHTRRWQDDNVFQDDTFILTGSRVAGCGQFWNVGYETLLHDSISAKFPKGNAFRWLGGSRSASCKSFRFNHHAQLWHNDGQDLFGDLVVNHEERVESRAGVCRQDCGAIQAPPPGGGGPPGEIGEGGGRVSPDGWGGCGGCGDPSELGGML